jgi:hypothetical protein
VLRPPVELEVVTSAPPPLSGLVPARSPSAGHPEESATRDPELVSRECHSPSQSLPSSGSLAIARDDRSGFTGSRLRLLSIKSAPAAHPPISGAVRVAAGPWSMEEGWWSDAPAARDYWDVELSEGGLYRIYRDRASNAWFADGVYD